MAVLLPYTYLGPVDYYRSIANSKRIVLERHENFKKQTFRNRCTIYSPNGPLNLVVPTIHVSGERTMDIRKISYEQDWRKLHWKSFEAAYRSSPFFEYYEDDLQPILMKEYELVIDLNRALMDWVLDTLEIQVEITTTASYEEDYDGLDLRTAYSPKTYSTVIGDFKRYSQVFEDRAGFLPNLSIVDLIFNQGPRAKDYL